jgi:hypothetical protein
MSKSFGIALSASELQSHVYLAKTDEAEGTQGTQSAQAAEGSTLRISALFDLPVQQWQGSLMATVLSGTVGNEVLPEGVSVSLCSDVLPQLLDRNGNHASQLSFVRSAGGGGRNLDPRGGGGRGYDRANYHGRGHIRNQTPGSRGSSFGHRDAATWRGDPRGGSNRGADSNYRERGGSSRGADANYRDRNQRDIGRQGVDSGSRQSQWQSQSQPQRRTWNSNKSD